MDDEFKMMNQDEHDAYTRELENKLDFLINTLMNYESMTAEDIDNTLSEMSLIGKESEWIQ